MGIIIRQSIKGTIANYIGVVIGFVTTFFVLTRFLTAEEIGLTRVLVDAAALVAALAQLGTGSSIVRYYPYFKDERTRDHGFFFWTLIVPLIGFAVFALLYTLLRTPVESIFSEKSPLFVTYYYAVLPLAFCLVYMAVFEANANVLMRIVVPKITREVVIRVLALGVYLLYAFKLLTINEFVVAFCSIYGIATLINVAYVFSLKRISIKPDFGYITRALRKDYLLYTFFLVVSAFATAFTPVISTFFISAQQGLSSTGIFAIATYIAAIIEIPYRSLGAIAQPQMSQTIKDHDIATANKLCKSVSLHQLAVGIFLLFIIWINIDLLFALLPNGDIYLAAKNVVLLLGIAKLLNSTLSICTSALNYSKYYYLSLVFALVQTIATILLNNSLIPTLGINGAALATLLAYLVFYIAMLAIVWHYLRISPFSMAQIKTLCIIALLFGINFVATSIASDWLSTQTIVVQCAEAVVRTSLLCLIGIILTYKWHISSDINMLIDRIIKR